MILNGLFKKCDDILLPLLHGLINKIFDSDLFPHSWSRSCIVPLFKKNDVNDVNKLQRHLSGQLFWKVIYQECSSGKIVTIS